ncbi:PREDICTED: pyrin [Condylura cristata]|uniref:pyrin n=1 Tax=Condylura cristata TaxID=143302 RepID=UPI0003347226|nr:PREDICTED: pyrin [Condylura cristata]
MAKSPSDLLLFSLEELVPYDFEKFKFKLQNTSLENEHRRIPRGQLQIARPVKVATLLVSHYGEQCAVRLTLQILKAINQNLLAEELHRALGPDYLVQEGCADNCEAPCSCGDSRPRRPRPPGSPEADGQRQSGYGAAGLPAGQPEAGRASQKRPQGKRKDQKGPEGPDAAGKLGARSLVQPARKGPAPGKLPGDRDRGGHSGTGLRRNASSAGRLQGLSSAGPLTKRDLRMPSGKKRPKSLEIPISSEGAPPNPETPLTQEHKDSAPTPSQGAAPDGGAAGNPAHPQAQEGGALRSRRSAAFPTREGGTWEPPDPTASWEKTGMEGPEPPAAPGATAGSLCHQPAGRPRQQAGCPPLPAQEGAPAGGARGCAPPQCERHMQQAQLLFCEDHGEPVCLICRLSQEHRGHRVLPIQEAALEYKEHIDGQLERLKGLRASGEKQRAERERETADFLKQTGIQKQKVRCQLENVGHFLKQQEQLLVAKLEELEQAIEQVGQTHGARVARDIALLDELIGQLEAKQGQPEWELMRDVGAILHRAKTATVPEPWATPEEVQRKLRLLYRKSQAMARAITQFSETLHVEMKALNLPELTGAQAYATVVILDPATAHCNLLFSDDMRSVRLGNKSDRLPDSPERFESCIFTLGVPSFISGCHYWEVEVGSKTGWVLGVCNASASRKGSITLSPQKGYWVVMMTKRTEYQASTLPPTRLHMPQPPRRVGVFLDCKAGSISFYNVTAKSHMYSFTSSPPPGPLQPIFSPGTHDGGKNMDPLTICPVEDLWPH